MFGHGQSGLLLGGEPARHEPAGTADPTPFPEQRPLAEQGRLGGPLRPGEALIPAATTSPERGTEFRTMRDYMGHKNPRHTGHYTRISGRKFVALFK